MNATASAMAHARSRKSNASAARCPKGGFPMTNVRPSLAGGAHSRKSALTIPPARGSMSTPRRRSCGNSDKNEASPALGSMINEKVERSSTRSANRTQRTARAELVKYCSLSTLRLVRTCRSIPSTKALPYLSIALSSLNWIVASFQIARVRHLTVSGPRLTRTPMIELPGLWARTNTHPGASTLLNAAYASLK